MQAPTPAQTDALNPLDCVVDGAQPVQDQQHLVRQQVKTILRRWKGLPVLNSATKSRQNHSQTTPDQEAAK